MLNIVEDKKIIEFQRLLLRWGRKNIRNYRWRRKSASNYEKVVIEVLLQRTKSETVSQFAPGFLRHYPSWKKLAEAKPRDIEKALKPIGLSKQRAPRLASLAKAIVANGGRIPHRREELEKLPGVGQYIANSIELLCFGKPEPLLDVNMARVLERYFGPRKLADIRYDPYLQRLAKEVIEKSPEPVNMNWVILDFAALVCKKRKPLCDTCPLCKVCKKGGVTK